MRQVLQSVMDLLQIATGIAKCEDYYKLRQLSLLQKCDTVYYKLRQVLQSVMDLLQIATGITKCDGFITNCDRYCKV